MNDSSNKEVFELILREISLQEFDALLNCGVRDIAGFLLLTEETLRHSGIPLSIATELMVIKQKLCEQTADYCNDSNSEEPAPSISKAFHNGHQSEIERRGRTGTPIPPDLEARLSTRAQNLLAREKILTCEQLLELTKKDLFNFAHIGKKTVTELKNLQSKITNTLPGFQEKSRKGYCQSDRLQSESLASPGIVSSAHHPGRSGFCPSWPADWSLLSRTLPELFQVSIERDNGSIYDEFTTIDSLGLSPYDTDQLTKMVVFPEDPAGNLFVMSVGYLLQSGISDEALTIILGHLMSFSEGTSPAQLPNPYSNLSDTAIYKDIPLDLIEDQLITDFSYPDILAKNKCTSPSITWGDIANISERDIIVCLGFSIRGLEAIQYLWNTGNKALEIHTVLSKGLPAEAYSSFERLIDTFVRTVGKKSHDCNVLKGRLGVLDGRKWTLEELGQHESLTRERIRQIEKQLMPVLLKPRTQERLCRLWITVEEILTSGGGACCAAEITELLTKRWKWTSAPSDRAIASLLSLSSNYELVWESPIRIIKPQHKCVGCAAIRPVLTKEVENQPDGTLSFKIADTITRSFCHSQGCAGVLTIERFSNGFFHFLSDVTKELLADETSLYTQYAWVQKYGKQGSGLMLVETILHNAGRPMHFREVHAAVNKDRTSYRKLLERNIYAYIERSVELFLWGPGTFIHKDYIIIPDSIIAEIEKDIISRLKENSTPFLSIVGIFFKNKNMLTQAGIPNAQALYSCMRLKENHGLDCYDYPYVKILGSKEQHIPILLVLETFITEQEDVVTLATLKKFAVDTLCMNETSFQSNLPNIPNLLRINIGEYIHLDHLELVASQLMPIVDHLRKLLQNYDHVSAQKIFDEKKISCKLLNISTPIFLFSLLKHFYWEQFELSRYPQICHLNSMTNKKQPTGIIAEIVNYIFQKKSPCSISELFSYFVEELKYNQQSVNLCIYSHNQIKRYSDGVVIHFNTLAWSEANQSALELLALAHLTDRENAGKPYGHISHIYEYMHDQLPNLPEHISWTPTLIGALLIHKERFRIMGTQRNAFVSIPNQHGIESLDDLLYFSLETNYDGAANLDLFISDMRESGVLIKKLTPMMLGVDSRVVIDGNVVRLAKLSGHVTRT
ncbi:MAG: hypothetical protein FP810_06435 [Desulfocapsa sp.]|nr:hypothetical protein [Desulfocapsa sp.]MBU3946428.1 hypothetical protein [Pseudomonadota bacterium]MCG2743381.1 hypothetical protein [Desulfobacteraceae bacterium]